MPYDQLFPVLNTEPDFILDNLYQIGNTQNQTAIIGRAFTVTAPIKKPSRSFRFDDLVKFLSAFKLL